MTVRRRPRRTRLLIVSMILAGVMLFFFALPLFLGPGCRVDPGKRARMVLRDLTLAELDFQMNDRDGNHEQDFWVRDVSGLHFLTPEGSEDPIGLIDISIARADDAPCRDTAAARAACESGPRIGYLYRALMFHEDEAGKKVPYDDGKGRNVSRFGFVAYPVGPGTESFDTLILSETNLVFRKKLQGGRVDTFPRDPERAGWKTLD
jgi:hypothetical protein